ncbi:MAG: hypothetical protein BRD21_03600 [Halobacteriales archaeon SW_8_66_22]|nr:MAG: hypothetical protein BRD21_03600 [Halobacteriales archaeon SW_8_66_22]
MCSINHNNHDEVRTDASGEKLLYGRYKLVSMVTYCPNCGEEVTQGASFCSNCGKDITQEQSAAGNTTRTDQATGQQEAEWGESQEHQQTHRGPQVPRKNAVDTLSQAFSWLTSEPELIGLFLVGGLLSGIIQVLAPALNLVGLVINSVVGAVAFIAAERKLQDSQFDVMTAVESAVGRIVSLVIIALGYAIAVGIGLLLLVLPGIYLGVRLSLALPACILDGKGISESFSASWEVAGEHMGKIFGIFLIYFGFFIALGVLSFAAGSQALLEDPTYLIGSSIISALLAAVYNLAIGRVYLENRPQQSQQFENQSQQY